MAALRWFTAGFAERSGIEVNLNTPRKSADCPRGWNCALFRIVQESLTNVQRHSKSDAAWVTLSEHKDRAELRITDSGVGVPADIIEQIKQGRTIEGIGLRGMYERVRELGGQRKLSRAGWSRRYPQCFHCSEHKQHKQETRTKSANRELRASGWK